MPTKNAKNKKEVAPEKLPAETLAKPKINPAELRRARPPEPEEPPELPPTPVSAGAVEKALDLAFNPSREKIREVTIIDRLQGRFLPQLDIINTLTHYCLEIAAFRQDAVEYKRLFHKERPIPPDVTEEFMIRTAQWQKSVQGINLTKITDIALAETETRSGEEEGTLAGADAWKD